MTASRSEHDSASDEAARWLIALEESPDDEALRERFSAWLAADPAHVEAWTDTSDVYALLGQLPVTPDAGVPPAMHTRAVHRPRVWWAAGALLAGLAAALLVVVAPSLRLRLLAEYRTAAGEQRTVTLPDGSVMHLGPQTAIATSFQVDRRRIELLQGEAFFTVAPDRARPFEVVAGEARATAVGTAFETRVNSAETLITVEEGVVRAEWIDDAAGALDPLTAGQWTRFAAGHQHEQGRLHPSEIAAWRQGLVVARDAPLATVIDHIRPFHRGAIFIAGGDFGRQRVTGVYNAATDPLAALRAVVAPHGGVVRQLTPWLVVISAS
mgnify:FL=1